MEDQVGIFLRDVFLEAFENIRENDTDDDRKYHEIMSVGTKKAKEGFIDSSHVLHNVVHGLNAFPSAQEFYLSSAYAIELVSLIPDASSRAMQIISIRSFSKLDDVAAKYLEEACKCYIYGLYLSSIIMCRASVEYSFHKKLNYNETQGPRPNIYELLSEAKDKRYIDNMQRKFVISMYKMASDCVHGREQFNSETCLTVLNKTKILIGKLLGNAI